MQVKQMVGAAAIGLGLGTLATVAALQADDATQAGPLLAGTSLAGISISGKLGAMIGRSAPASIPIEARLNSAWGGVAALAGATIPLIVGTAILINRSNNQNGFGSSAPKDSAIQSTPTKPSTALQPSVFNYGEVARVVENDEQGNPQLFSYRVNADTAWGPYDSSEGLHWEGEWAGTTTTNNLGENRPYQAMLRTSDGRLNFIPLSRTSLGPAKIDDSSLTFRHPALWSLYENGNKQPFDPGLRAKLSQPEQLPATLEELDGTRFARDYWIDPSGGHVPEPLIDYTIDTSDAMKVASADTLRGTQLAMHNKHQLVGTVQLADETKYVVALEFSGAKEGDGIGEAGQTQVERYIEPGHGFGPMTGSLS